MEIAVIQSDIVWRSPAANVAALQPRVQDAARRGAELVVLTETFATGFSAPFAEIAQPMDGQVVSFLRESAELTGAWVCGSVVLQQGSEQRPSNTFVLAGPGGALHCYRKVHTSFFDGEREEVEPGEDTLTVKIGDVRVTPFVCYDLRFADIFWDAAPTTDCYLVVANWPAARHLHWQTLLRARAVENQAYVVGANRVGVDGNKSAYAGGSLVIDPLGADVASADDQENTIIAKIERSVVDEVREQFPFLSHRRLSAPRRDLAAHLQGEAPS